MQMRTRVLKLCCLCCAGVGKNFVQSMMSHVGSLMERKKSHVRPFGMHTVNMIPTLGQHVTQVTSIMPGNSMLPPCFKR
ncbi:hypothetical protein EDC04DRAFT_399141 [Pisolithus marmoratus]|nr:hypothetical protein EDC04DRAFT_399141 [Pisolithus marmoratus]